MSTPKTRPIIFSAPMVRAILSGTKTQTRRVIASRYLSAIARGRDGQIDDLLSAPPPHRCPYGWPGERLWVRETWQDTRDIAPDGGWVYRATDPDWDTMDGWTWRPAIHMPKAASRITLEIVSVRVERLQDISEEDARAEGVTLPECDYLGERCGNGTGFGCPRHGDDAHRREFARLWESINGKRAPWASNPWVWVIEFRRVEP